MKNIQYENAMISSTVLGPEGHGIFSASLNLEFDGSGQSFGGYALDKHNGLRGAGSERIGTAYGMEFIRRIMDTVGVDKWEDLKGQHVRVEREHHKVHAIGHITKNKWFRPETDLKEFIT